MVLSHEALLASPDYREKSVITCNLYIYIYNYDSLKVFMVSIIRLQCYLVTQSSTDGELQCRTVSLRGGKPELFMLN